MNLFKLFNFETEKKKDFGQLFDRIAQLGEGLGDEELKEVTAVAGLLGRVAYADSEISKEEQTEIKSILQKKSKLTAAAIEIILTLIVEKRVELLTLEEHFYARLANEVMSKEARKQLLENLFQIAAADGTICLEEENTLYGTAVSLKIPKNELTELKRKFKSYLSVFQ